MIKNLLLKIHQVSKELWKNDFKDFFIIRKDGLGFDNENEIISKLTILNEYRAACFAHVAEGAGHDYRQGRDTYHPVKRESVKNALERFLILID